AYPSPLGYSSATMILKSLEASAPFAGCPVTSTVKSPREAPSDASCRGAEIGAAGVATARRGPIPSDPPQEHEHQHDHQHQPQPAARAVAPIAAVTPVGQAAQEQHDQND